jgi:hypothetical protein
LLRIHPEIKAPGFVTSLTAKNKNGWRAAASHFKSKNLAITP